MRSDKAIAMYIRLSLEDHNIDGDKKTESNSVSAQRKLLSDFLKNRDEFKDARIAEYVDDGYSGANFERPSFKRMLRDAREGRIQVIVIKDFSRFGRDYLEVGNYLEKILPLLKIRVISVNDGFDSDNCAGMTGGMCVALKNMLNAMYSRDLSVKVQSAMLTHVKKGEYLSPRPKYGYRKDPKDRHHLLVDPDAAELVKLIFTMAAEGTSRRQIARYLNENKVPTCSVYMVQKGYWKSGLSQKEIVLWNDSTLKHMLKDETYLGNIVWGGVIVKGTHEPIVSDELFQRVCEASVKKAPKITEPPRRGGVPIECAYCGRRLDTSSAGKIYKCSKAGVTGIPGCQNVRIRVDLFEETVLRCTRNFVHILSENPQCRKQERRLSSKKMKVYSDYRTGALTKEEYRKECAEIEKEAEITQKRMRDAGEKQEEPDDIAALMTFDRKVLSKVIERIYVHGNDKIEIIWKMDDFF